MAIAGQTAKTDRSKPVESYLEWDSFEMMQAIEADGKMSRYRELTDMETAIKKEKKELSDELLPALIAVKQKAVRSGDLLLIQCTGVSPSSISYQKLILLGVDSDIIQKATEPGKEYTYIQVKRSKEE